MNLDDIMLSEIILPTKGQKWYDSTYVRDPRLPSRRLPGRVTLTKTSSGSARTSADVL